MTDLAEKDKEGKPPLADLPLSVLEEVAHALEWGSKQGTYARGQWKHGYKYADIASAALRHIVKYLDTSRPDTDESGYHHLSHAIIDLMFLKWYIENGVGEDNRI